MHISFCHDFYKMKAMMRNLFLGFTLIPGLLLAQDVVFIDASNAFDQIRRNQLQAPMVAPGVTGKYVQPSRPGEAQLVSQAQIDQFVRVTEETPGANGASMGTQAGSPRASMGTYPPAAYPMGTRQMGASGGPTTPMMGAPVGPTDSSAGMPVATSAGSAIFSAPQISKPSALVLPGTFSSNIWPPNYVQPRTLPEEATKWNRVEYEKVPVIRQGVKHLEKNVIYPTDRALNNLVPSP